MLLKVELGVEARRDLQDIFDYIESTDSRASAEYVLDRVGEVIRSLEEFPERGSHPKELLDLGIRRYRRVFFKPYRVVYRIMDSRVVVYLVADGRRDMPALLARRLLGG